MSWLRPTVRISASHWEPDIRVVQLPDSCHGTSAASKPMCRRAIPKSMCPRQTSIRDFTLDTTPSLAERGQANLYLQALDDQRMCITANIASSPSASHSA